MLYLTLYSKQYSHTRVLCVNAVGGSPKALLLNSICSIDCGRSGISTSTLTLGGTYAKEGELPWLAIVYTKDLKPFKQICSGTIIAPALVLSGNEIPLYIDYARTLFSCWHTAYLGYVVVKIKLKLDGFSGPPLLERRGKLKPPSRFAVAAGKVHRAWNNPRDVHAQKSDCSKHGHCYCANRQSTGHDSTTTVDTAIHRIDIDDFSYDENSLLRVVHRSDD
ncbi:hypothetical protein EVAR_97827_1 [Eumeta japonica]|uniref:Uncharacterized protein n=1 Tax=Eumeta variegata TaxID=151549 RepID=A0A4C1XCA5_EUMVA|nr:hypothetical protein EVAR_97827_1 [Eumeta japonica]